MATAKKPVEKPEVKEDEAVEEVAVADEREWVQIDSVTRVRAGVVDPDPKV